jgi:hypothetical protein
MLHVMFLVTVQESAKCMQYAWRKVEMYTKFDLGSIIERDYVRD